MIKTLIKKILFYPRTDIDQLIEKASRFPRYKDTFFEFRGMKFHVTDFISVAYQLNEYFIEGRMNFKSNGTPVIYDCGANIGVSILYFKQLYPQAQIKAFEPDPKIFGYLKENLAANNVQDIELFNSAVWTTNEEITFGSEGADGGSIFYSKNSIKVPSIRLSSMLEKEQHIDLLKIDIEGAETAVLQDCQKELPKIQYLFVEYHSWKKNPQELNVLLSILQKNGFRYYIRSIMNFAKQPFVEQSFPNGMDNQLDIHAINTNYKK